MELVHEVHSEVYAVSLLISATFFPWGLWKMMGCTTAKCYNMLAEKQLSRELPCCVVNNSKVLDGAITSTL